MTVVNRFVAFAGRQDVVLGGAADSIGDFPTLLEAVRCCDRAFDGIDHPSHPGGRLACQWAHVWDLVEDDVVMVPATPLARLDLIAELTPKAPCDDG